MVETIKNCFSPMQSNISEDRFIKWNNNNFSNTILNVDGSYLGSPIRAGFGGVLRNNAGFYLSGFSGFIQGSYDILHVELQAIYHGIILANDLGIVDLVCYSYSLHSINLIKGPTMRFHIHALLIQDIKELIVQNNVTICHTLREGNQCADFMAKLGASTENDLTYHASPPENLLNILKNDAAGTLYSRE